LREAIARKSFKAGAKVDSKLAKLGREIGGVADQIYSKTGAAQAFAKAQAAAVRLRRQTLDALKAVEVFFKVRTPAITQLSRKTLGTAIHGARPIRKTQTPHARDTISLKQDTRHGRRSLLDGLLLAACFGLLIACGVVLLGLFLQVQNMQSEIDRSQSSLSDAKAQLSQLESTVQNFVHDRAAQTTARSAAPPQPALVLSKDEKATIRQFIRVLPPAPGGQPKIHIGDAVPNAASALVPDALVEQMPKLRGARFLIDQDGAIVILGEGSNRADAIVLPR
jgi:hypothetical protein